MRTLLLAATGLAVMVSAWSTAKGQNEAIVKVPIPLEMHFCAQNCLTFALEDDNRLVNYTNLPGQENEKRVFTIVKFAPDDVLIERVDTGSFPGSGVYAGKMEPGNRAIRGKGWRISWGSALESQPGSNLERDDPGLLKVKRSATLDAIASEEPSTRGEVRNGCTLGMTPAGTRRNRAKGYDDAPPASDICLRVISRDGREGRILDEYQRIAAMIESRLEPKVTAKMIATFSLKGGPYPEMLAPLPIGTGIVITPSIAWDAGFTAFFFEDFPRPKPPAGNDLNGDTEICLEDWKNRVHMEKALPSPVCYAVGFAQAQKAFPPKDFGYVYGTKGR